MISQISDGATETEASHRGVIDGVVAVAERDKAGGCRFEHFGAGARAGDIAVESLR
jgi:hypothetical protein